MAELVGCVICGHEGHDVKPSLIEWREPLDGARFDIVPRCEDRRACRRRCEDLGEQWPIPEPSR